MLSTQLRLQVRPAVNYFSCQAADLQLSNTNLFSGGSALESVEPRVQVSQEEKQQALIFPGDCITRALFGLGFSFPTFCNTHTHTHPTFNLGGCQHKDTHSLNCVLPPCITPHCSLQYDPAVYHNVSIQLQHSPYESTAWNP